MIEDPPYPVVNLFQHTGALTGTKYYDFSALRFSRTRLSHSSTFRQALTSTLRHQHPRPCGKLFAVAPDAAGTICAQWRLDNPRLKSKWMQTRIVMRMFQR